MRKTLIAIVMMAAGVIGCDRNKGSTETVGNKVGKAALNVALQVSETDASVLSDISDKLEGACARNRFGLTEEACIQKVRTGKDACIQQTAQKYPGQISDVEKMQAVASTYVNCLFQP